MILERVTEATVQGRALFVVDVRRPDELALLPQIPSKHYACLLVWDADREDDATIAVVADALLQTGAVYVCAWGRDCERVHDAVDSEVVGIAEALHPKPLVMTTWHSDESLAEAIWYLLFTAQPVAVYSATCTASVAVIVDSPARADEIRRAFQNPDSFNKEMLDLC